MSQDIEIAVAYIRSILPSDFTLRTNSVTSKFWTLYDKYNFTIVTILIQGSKIIVLPKRRPIPNNGYNPIQLNLADARFSNKLLNIISKKPKPMED